MSVDTFTLTAAGRAKIEAALGRPIAGEEIGRAGWELSAEPNAHRHPCPADGCPGVECFTTLEGCGDGTREGFCPMEDRRGEPCPNLAARA